MGGGESNPSIHKLQPKLRMIANADTRVSAVRAEHCAGLAIPDRDRLAAIPLRRESGSYPIERSQLAGSAVPRSLEEPGDAVADVFVRLVEGARPPAALSGVTAGRGDEIAATIPIAQLTDVAASPAVAYIELGDPLTRPIPEVSGGAVKAPAVGLRRYGSTRLHDDGRGVLIGIIDVEGFDFAHEDFLDDAGETRFIRIWDQDGGARPTPKERGTADLDYGAEFRSEELNRAIAMSAEVGLPPQELERQSQMVEGAHATHVASIAAGNRGVARRALIAGVLISLPREDQDRRRSLYDSTRVAHAVEYILAVARQLGDIPVSINISLGTNGHAHDASSAVNRWIDAALSVPGRSVTIAAGNAGQELPEFEGDTGYVMGRIHTRGRIPARDLTTDLEWLVVGNGVADISENELELWYAPQDRFAISVLPPGGDWIGPIEPRQFVENRQMRDGSFVSIYNELYHPANGSNHIAVYLSPLLSPDGVVGVAAGRWVVRLLGREIRDGSFNGWIERDDPRRIGRVGPREAWAFPSFFSERTYVDESTVSSLGCGHRIVSVANLDESRERINVSSSQGPTRDGRPKPEVAAPGTGIVAAKGFSAEATRWVAMTGTSMASPHVAGLIGLMLAIEPSLTADQIRGIIQRSARPLPGSDFSWLNDAGYGMVDPTASLREAAELNERRDMT